MNIELNTNLSVPFIFVKTESEKLAIDVVNHDVYDFDNIDGITGYSDVEMEVNQNFSEEATEFTLLGETIIYSASGIELKR